MLKARAQCKQLVGSVIDRSNDRLVVPLSMVINIDIDYGEFELNVFVSWHHRVFVFAFGVIDKQAISRSE